MRLNPWAAIAAVKPDPGTSMRIELTASCSLLACSPVEVERSSMPTGILLNKIGRSQRTGLHGLFLLNRD